MFLEHLDLNIMLGPPKIQPESYTDFIRTLIVILPGKSCNNEQITESDINHTLESSNV